MEARHLKEDEAAAADDFKRKTLEKTNLKNEETRKKAIKAEIEKIAEKDRT